MDNGLSASDIALLNNEGGMGGNAFMWIFALLILAGGGFGGLGNNRSFADYTSAQTQEILFGQQFQGLDNKIDRIGNGIADLGYAIQGNLNNVQTVLGGAITTEGRNIQTQLCAINSNIDNKFAALEKSQLEQRIAEQSQQISQLQMAQMMCGIPKINNNAWGVYPYATNGCGCTGLTTV